MRPAWVLLQCSRQRLPRRASQGEPPWAVSLHLLEQQQAMAWEPSAVAGHVRTMQACGLPLLV